MAFNPDEYIKSEKGGATSFNPDAYIGKKVPESIWKKAGLEITPEMAQKNWVLAGLGKTAQDITTIPYAFFNQMAFDYPRQILEKKAGITVPLAESPVARGISYGAGVAGGLKNPIFKAFGGANLLTAPLRKKALAGGLQMLAAPTKEGIVSLKEKPGQFLQGAALGGALPLAGKAVATIARKTIASPKAIEWAARNVSGIKDFTKKTIERLGNKVFNPDYYAEDYVGRVFTPKVQNYILDQIDTLGPNWSNEARIAKFGSKDIKTFAGMDRATRKTFVNLIRQGATAQEAAESLAANAKQEYADIINKAQTPINITNTFNKIKATLINNGWATEDAAGMLQAKTNLGVPNSTRDNLIRIWNHLRTQGQTVISPKTKNVYKILSNGQEFQGSLYELESILTGDPKRDRVVMGVIDTFKNDAESLRTGIVGLKRVSKLYSDALNLKNYAPKVASLVDPVRINAKFAGINAATAARKYQALESIRNQIPKEMFDDLTAHYAARNFAPEFYPSLSGIRKLGITEASKAYYKRFPQGMQMPAKLKAATQAIKAAVVPPARAVGRAAERIINEPYFSPGTKAGAQALLESRKGQAVSVPGAISASLKKKPAKVGVVLNSGKKIPSVVFHKTSSEAASQIESQGFKIGGRGVNTPGGAAPNVHAENFESGEMKWVPEGVEEAKVGINLKGLKIFDATKLAEKIDVYDVPKGYDAAAILTRDGRLQEIIIRPEIASQRIIKEAAPKIKGIIPSPGLNVNKQNPLRTLGLHKISYFGDTGEMALSTSSERHADLVKRVKMAETAQFAAVREANPQLVYSGKHMHPFDEPTHIRAIITTRPNESIIGVRPFIPSMFSEAEDIQRYQDIYDNTLTEFLKKAEKMSNKPVFVNTGITNADLDRGIESISEEHLKFLREHKQLWKVDSKFFKDYVIIGGVPQRISKRR